MTPEQCQRLKQGRLAARYSQRDAADALAVSLRTYQKWEQGQSNPEHIETLIRIATLFNISLDWWLMGTHPTGHEDKRILNGINNLCPEDRETMKRVLQALNR